MAKANKQQHEPTMVERLLGIAPENAETLLGSLTPREAEVADLMSTGSKNRDIAKKLGISTKTLDIHRAKVKEKLKARGSVDIARVVLAKKLADSR